MTRNRTRLGSVMSQIGHLIHFGFTQEHAGGTSFAERQLGGASGGREEAIEKLLTQQVTQQVDRLVVREILGHIPRRVPVHEGQHRRVLQAHRPDEHIANTVGLDRRTEVQPDQGPVLSALAHVVQEIVHRLGTHVWKT